MTIQASIEQIVTEELERARTRILERLPHPAAAQPQPAPPCPPADGRDPLPPNPRYRQALDGYLRGETHSAIARALNVSISAVKKYYSWLVLHGYLPGEDRAPSEMERRVADYLFAEKHSLREAAKHFDCSVSNIIYRRDSALRKGYAPPEEQTPGP